MKISDMEHMTMPWKLEFDDSDKSWMVVTDTDGDPWYVASVALHLPGDESGERTAKALCDAHNSALRPPSNSLTVSPDAKREANTSGGIGSP